MPLYEYKCSKCDQTFEVRQKFSDSPLETHPGCDGVVEKVLSASAFQFKGSGFYITDYARKQTSKGGNGTAGKSDEAAAKPAANKPASETGSSKS